MTAIEDDLTRAHGIVGTHQGTQGAGQTVPEDSICCMTCGWMRCSDYSAHLAPIVAKHVAAGQEQALLDAAHDLSTEASPKWRTVIEACAHRVRMRAATYTTTKEK